MKLIKAIAFNAIKKYTVMGLLVAGMGVVLQMNAMTPERQSKLDNELYNAVSKDNVQNVKIALDNGADPDAKNMSPRGLSPLETASNHLAIYTESIAYDTRRAFLRHNQKTLERMRTLIENQQSATQIVRMLVEKGADVNTSFMGELVLSRLLRVIPTKGLTTNELRNIQFVVSLLIKAGAEIDPEILATVKAEKPELSATIEQALAERSHMIGEGLPADFPDILTDLTREYADLPTTPVLPKPRRGQRKIMRFRRDYYPEQAAKEELEQMEQSTRPDDRSLLRLTPIPRTRTRTAITRTAQES